MRRAEKVLWHVKPTTILADTTVKTEENIEQVQLSILGE